jgi:hypothetical protein
LRIKLNKLRIRNTTTKKSAKFNIKSRICLPKLLVANMAMFRGLKLNAQKTSTTETIEDITTLGLVLNTN